MLSEHEVWEGWVGNQSVSDFMDHFPPGTSPEEAAEKYVHDTISFRTFGDETDALVETCDEVTGLLAGYIRQNLDFLEQG